MCTKFDEQVFSHTGPATWNSTNYDLLELFKPLNINRRLTFFTIAFNSASELAVLRH